MKFSAQMVLQVSHASNRYRWAASRGSQFLNQEGSIPRLTTEGRRMTTVPKHMMGFPSINQEINKKYPVGSLANT
jgi:hypothetical protein